MRGDDQASFAGPYALGRAPSNRARVWRAALRTLQYPSSNGCDTKKGGRPILDTERYCRASEQRRKVDRLPRVLRPGEGRSPRIHHSSTGQPDALKHSSRDPMVNVPFLVPLLCAHSSRYPGSMAADVRDVDPAELRVPSSRSSGADPVKLQMQIARHGRSISGMPRLLAYGGPTASWN